MPKNPTRIHIDTYELTLRQCELLARCWHYPVFDSGIQAQFRQEYFELHELKLIHQRRETDEAGECFTWFLTPDGKRVMRMISGLKKIMEKIP